MSWGKGITLALILFVGMIGTLVYLSTQQRFSLVTENYYEESLDYDAVQNKISNYTRLGESVEVEFIKEGELIRITLPPSFEGRTTEGEVHLYHPVDERNDVRYKLEQPFEASTASLKKGKWNIIVDWEADGKAYQFERIIFIN